MHLLCPNSDSKRPPRHHLVNDFHNVGNELLRISAVAARFQYFNCSLIDDLAKKLIAITV